MRPGLERFVTQPGWGNLVRQTWSTGRRARSELAKGRLHRTDPLVEVEGDRPGGAGTLGSSGRELMDAAGRVLEPPYLVVQGGERLVPRDAPRQLARPLELTVQRHSLLEDLLRQAHDPVVNGLPPASGHRSLGSEPSTEPARAHAERSRRWSMAAGLGLHSHRSGADMAERLGTTLLARRKEETPRAPQVARAIMKATGTNSTRKSISSSNSMNRWYGQRRANAWR